MLKRAAQFKVSLWRGLLYRGFVRVQRHNKEVTSDAEVHSVVALHSSEQQKKDLAAGILEMALTECPCTHSGFRHSMPFFCQKYHVRLPPWRCAHV